MATVLINNKAQIEFNKTYLDRIELEAKLPSNKRIILVFNDGPLPFCVQGACVLEELLEFSPKYAGICDCSGVSRWDCCIAISKKYSRLGKHFPAYLTYLIAHEFGHAHICLSNINLHIHYCLIEYFIKKASDEKIKYLFELPQEKLFDQFGRYIAESLYSEETFKSEIKQLISESEEIEKKRLRQILMLAPLNNFNNLRNELIKFSMPYKKKLIDYWEEDFDLYRDHSLTSKVKNQNFENYFKS